MDSISITDNTKLTEISLFDHEKDAKFFMDIKKLTLRNLPNLEKIDSRILANVKHLVIDSEIAKRLVGPLDHIEMLEIELDD